MAAGVSRKGRSHPAESHLELTTNSENPQSRQTAISGGGFSGAALTVLERFK
jgi:hypothetical protein